MFKKLDAQRIEKLRSDKRYTCGFTILEVMIALAIFGFLMLYVSQFMHLEIRLFDKATRQDDLEQKARFAMMHIVDQIRTTPSPMFYPGPDVNGMDAGIYAGSYSGSYANCKININPLNTQAIDDLTINDDSTLIHYDPTLRKLMSKGQTGDYLISDHIRWIKFEQASSRLIKISILAKNYDPSNPNDTDDPGDPRFLTVNAYQLITWVRF